MLVCWKSGLDDRMNIRSLRLSAEILVQTVLGSSLNVPLGGSAKLIRLKL